MTDQDPIHTDCGFEVGDSGDSHLRAQPFQSSEFPKPLDRPLTDEEIQALADDNLKHSVELSEWVMPPEPTAAVKLCMQCKTTPAEMYCEECSRALYAVNAVFTGEP